MTLDTKRGLTLTEVLIVIGIIAFLIVMVVINSRTQIFKGNDARRKAELRRIGIAAEEYEKDNNCYPPTIPSCKPGTGFKPYLNKIPCDPITKANYLYEADTSHGSCPKWFRIYTDLENEKDPDYMEGIGPGGNFSFYYPSMSAPKETEEIPPSDFFGCFNKVCQAIAWDESINAPECAPNFGSLSTCEDFCPTNPENFECKDQ